MGTAAVQLAAVLGARVIAVVSTEAKAAAARAAGAHENVPAEGFRAAVAELTGGRGVDVVVDPVGGDRFTDSLRSLAPEGRMLVVGFTGGDTPLVKANRLLFNNIDVVGVGWGAYWLARPEYLQEQWQELLPHLETGRLDPVLGSVHPLTAAVDALSELDERRATGRQCSRSGEAEGQAPPYFRPLRRKWATGEGTPPRAEAVRRHGAAEHTTQMG